MFPRCRHFCLRVYRSSTVAEDVCVGDLEFHPMINTRVSHANTFYQNRLRACFVPGTTKRYWTVGLTGLGRKGSSQSRCNWAQQ